MKNINYLLLALLVIILTSCSEEEKIVKSLNSTFSIESVSKGKTYPIWVYLPEDYNSNRENYPTIYVLDAEENQEFIAAKCRSISAQMNVKNAIIVGIGYGDNRENDYTPTHTDMDDGESLQFLNFIKYELIPQIEYRYRADSNRNSRAIIGHSFGGLCGTYAFTNHNEVFGNYLLLSPSLFYDNEIVLQYEQASRNLIKDSQQLVFIGFGGTEGPMIVESDYLNRIINKYYIQTRLEFNIVDGRGHVTSKNTNIEKALTFYFQNRY